MRIWHSFGTLARRKIHQAGMHDTQFSKFIKNIDPLDVSSIGIEQFLFKLAIFKFLPVKLSKIQKELL